MPKRIILLISTMIIILFPFTVLAKGVLIEENNLNVRSGPGTDFDRILQVHQGERYNLLEETDEWVKIQLDDYSGWVSKEYISIDNTENTEETSLENSETSIQTDMLSFITMPTNGIHLREGASTDYEIVTFTEKGQAFEVISEIDNWIEVTDGETTGFVMRDHIHKSDEQVGSLQNKTIVIDPGHGGRDVGAIGVNGTFEKVFAYLTAHELEKELTALGAEVVLTRQADEFIPLESRSALANSIDTDAFLSLHYNSFPDVPSVTGVESYYYHNQSMELAQYVHDEIVKETDERDRGVSFDDFHVTRQTFKPGVLLELGFISNEENEAKFQTTGYQKRIVTGIVTGLQKYFAVNP